MLQNFQQQPVKPEINTQPPVHTIHTHPQNVTAGLGVAPLHPPLPTQPTQQMTAFDKVAVSFVFVIIKKMYSLQHCRGQTLFGNCLDS